jgi:hypothetical protein
MAHFVLYKAAGSSSVAVRAGTETSKNIAIRGMPIKSAAIFFIIIAVTFLKKIEPELSASGRETNSAMLVPRYFSEKSRLK